MKDKFASFLREKERDVEFVKEFYDQHERGGVDLNTFLDNTAPSDYITSAFEFYRTDKGFDFWNKLSKEWRKSL